MKLCGGMLLVINSNGLIKQWGYVSDGVSGRTVTMSINYSTTTSYCINASIFYNTTPQNETIIIQQRISTNSFKVDTQNNHGFMWFTKGY
jgi:hypothetical protein